MADISLTSAQIAPLVANGAILRRGVAAAALTVGYLCYIDSSGTIQHADANASQAASRAVGVIVASRDGETSIASGDPVTYCVFGPVSGFSGMTPGTVLYVSDTVGRVADAAATFDRIIGYAESASVIFVSPEQNQPSSS